jgi:hypothetical protein
MGKESLLTKEMVAWRERSGFVTRVGVMEGNVLHKPRQRGPRGSDTRKASGATSNEKVIGMAGYSSSS